MLPFPQTDVGAFEISLLPSKISSWLTSMLQRLLVNAQLQEHHRTMGLEIGGGGSNTVNPLDATTFTWTGSPKREFSCWELLQWLSEREDILWECHEHLA
jgi:hypothetical protein